MTKRIISALVMTVLLFTMAGCGGKENNNKKSQNQHTVSNVATTAQATQINAWTRGNVKDKYGDSTSQPAAVCTVYGKFSNVATNNSNLTVKLYAVKSNSQQKLQFQLWEYGQYLATIPSSKNSYLKVSTPSGQSKEFVIFDSNGYIYAANAYKYANEDDLISMIINNETTEWSVVINSGTVPSTYHFTVENSGFKETYNKT